jgi:heme/copper-type cytochrome/quinol oxidase subunit 3
MSDAILLTSSLTMTLAVRATELRGRKAVVDYLALTLLLGLMFIIIKGSNTTWTSPSTSCPGLTSPILDYSSRG